MNATSNVTLSLAVLDATEGSNIPSDQCLSEWASAAFANAALNLCGAVDIAIRIVDELEMADLNGRFRDKPSATNVLSFVNDDPPIMSSVGPQEAEAPPYWLGDIALCAAVIDREAVEQGKALNDHYAHMVTHGVLHLCGFDHQNDDDAQRMEALEVAILAQFGINNPYD